MPPPSTHTIREKPTLPACSSTPLGEMKIPEPMMLPGRERGGERGREGEREREYERKRVGERKKRSGGSLLWMCRRTPCSTLPYTLVGKHEAKSIFLPSTPACSRA